MNAKSRAIIMFYDQAYIYFIKLSKSTEIYIYTVYLWTLAEQKC